MARATYRSSPSILRYLVFEFSDGISLRDTQVSLIDRSVQFELAASSMWTTVQGQEQRESEHASGKQAVASARVEVCDRYRQEGSGDRFDHRRVACAKFSLELIATKKRRGASLVHRPEFVGTVGVWGVAAAPSVIRARALVVERAGHGHAIHGRSDLVDRRRGGRARRHVAQ